jgi:predicted dehydrogenase
MLKVACFGAGYFSQFHFDAWRRIEGTQIVGLTNRDRPKAEATGLPVYDDLAQMLVQAKPDILDIITPPETHAEAITQALQHDLKAIICQKPFCTSLAEAEEITARAQAAGIPLIIHENFRFQPWYRVIRDRIAAGDIGRPLQARFHLRPGDGQGARAYLDRQPYFQQMPRFLIHETGVHWIDTFRFLFGDPVAVYADLRRVNDAIAGEDAGVFTLDHPGGMRCLFDGNRCLDHAATNTRRTMGEGVFEGTAGTLNLWGDGSVTLRAFGATDSSELLPPDTHDTFGGDCTYALCAHVAQALQDGSAFENLAQDYLTVLRVEAAIYRSAERGAKLTLT